jgi:hypothetical protein
LAPPPPHLFSSSPLTSAPTPHAPPYPAPPQLRDEGLPSHQQDLLKLKALSEARAEKWPNTLIVSDPSPSFFLSSASLFSHLFFCDVHLAKTSAAAVRSSFFHIHIMKIEVRLPHHVSPSFSPRLPLRPLFFTLPPSPQANRRRQEEERQRRSEAEEARKQELERLAALEREQERQRQLERANRMLFENSDKVKNLHSK